MAEKKCVFVVATPGYEPEMCELTLPNLKAYADRIGAEFCVIRERKYPDWPACYERLQIHELGKGNDWNISIDADMLIHPAIDDFTTWFSPYLIGNWWQYPATPVLNVENNIYFKRWWCKLDFALVECLIATSRYTHELWEPLSGTFSDYQNVFKDGYSRRIGEFCISQNMWKYGFKPSGMLRDGNNVFHLLRTSDNVEKPAEMALKKLKEWGLRP